MAIMLHASCRRVPDIDIPCAQRKAHIHPYTPSMCPMRHISHAPHADKLRKEADQMVRTLVDMEASYLSASFFRWGELSNECLSFAETRFSVAIGDVCYWMADFVPSCSY